jgi:hypothetical protein
VQEALSAWTVAHRPHHVVYRILGEQWAPRSHELRDLLSRNGVPFAFYPVDSTTGQELLQEFPGGDLAHRAWQQACCSERNSSLPGGLPGYRLVGTI